MKQLTYIFLALLIAPLASGQETKTVTKWSFASKEVFSVLTSDKKVKHGLYKKYEGKDKLIAEGAYENNEKVGEWKFYSGGVLEQTYNFTSKQLTYIAKTNYLSKAAINGTIQDVQLDTPPVYLGSKVALNEALNKAMTYPHSALRMGTEGKVLVSVWISDNDELSDIKLINGISADCDKEVINGLAKIEKNWVAGTKDGRKVRSELFVLVEYKLHDNGEKTIAVL